MKKLICVLLAAVMAVLLAACGGAPQETTQATTLPPVTTLPPQTTQPPLTAKMVEEQMIQALEGKSMTGGTYAMSFDITMTAPEGEEGEMTDISMEMSVEMDMKLSLDPLAMYSDSQISMKITGMDLSVGTESYMVMEDGQMVAYTHMLLDDSWTKTAVPEVQIQELNKEADYNWMLTKDEAELTLTEGVQTINGREVYVLGCTLTGEEMQKTMDTSAGMGDSFAELGIAEADLSELKVPTVYYIDAHTFYPVEIQMNVEGFDTLVNSILSGTLGMDPQTMGMEVKIGEMKMSMTNLSYDPVEVPPVPQAAYDAVAKGSTYLLEEDGKAVQVVRPMGWYEYGVETDILTIMKDDNSQAAIFFMYADITGIDFAQEIEDVDVADLKQINEYVGHGKGEPIGTYETMWVQETDVMNYYAWGPVGDAFIFMQVVDGTGQTMEQTLTPLLNAVSAPTAK